jgi:hypothetical protein
VIEALNWQWASEKVLGFDAMNNRRLEFENFMRRKNIGF